MTNSDQKWLSTAELADELELHINTVRRLINVGELPAYRIGQNWRVRRVDLVDYLEQRSNQLEPQSAAAADAAA